MMPGYVWEPTDDDVATANVTRLAAANGIEGYPELLERSQRDIAWFWDAVVSDLGIEFSAPYGKVVSTPRGIQWPVWFMPGEINIAHNCVDRFAGSTRTALVWEGEEGATATLTFGALATKVAAFADGLRSLGVRKGESVGLFLPMTPEAVIAFMAICRIGAIVVPIFSGFAARAVAVRLHDAGAKVLICADGFYRRGTEVQMKETADVAADAVPSVKHVVVVRRTGRDVTMREGRDLTFDALASGSGGGAPVRTWAEDPFMIAYTSGTTGKPKGSVHVHGGFLVKVAAEVAYQTDYRVGELLFWLSDPGWIMGPWEMVGTLALGGTVFLYDGAPDHPGPDRLWDMVARHRISTLGISPTLVRALMPAGDDAPAGHDLSSLRILGSTGEPWNTEPYLWFSRVVGGDRCPIINFSGGTEVGACFLSPAPVMPLKACSLGGPALGMAVDVYGPDGRPIRGDVGELVCTKPWPGMTRGIWGDPDRYLEAYWSRWDSIWVHGDWARVDDDGQWFLQGRSDDTMNVAGKRIGPAEVESVLVGDEHVIEAAVVGLPDDVKGEAIHCFVVLGDDAADAARERLSERVASTLGRAFRPASIRFVSQLPKTRNAKVLRRAVRAVALGQDPGDLTSLENPDSLDEIRAAR